MSTPRDSGSAISLPSGGGAIQGVEEKFSADPFTGVATLSVPISVPPGRNGLQPQLALGYSSSSGNGIAGIGWGIGVPRIARLTDKGVPRYDDARDVFVLSGAEELVPVPGAPAGAAAYRPRTEGLFARILHWKDQTRNYWEVRLKNGFVQYFGDPAGSAGDGSLLRDPDAPGRIFEWALRRQTDPFGNLMRFEYKTDTGDDEFHRWSQLYLERIRWIDWKDTAGVTRFLASVTLEYAPRERPDPLSSHRAGFEIRTRRRLKRINVATHAGQDRLVRSYRLGYLDEQQGAAVPPNGVSLLSSVTAVGHDGTEEEQLPPVEFGYTRFEPAERQFQPIEGDLPGESLANQGLAFADVTGDGLPDIIELNGSVRYWRNSGTGRFDSPRAMASSPAGLTLAAGGVQLVDANGDGRVDLLVSAGRVAGYFPMRSAGGWDERSFRPYREAPTFNLEDPDVRLVDLDGDGVTDALRAGSRFECFFNDPVDGWGETRFVERGRPENFPDVSFRDPRVHFADMTGDGLADIALVHQGSVEYWPSRGRGEFGRPVSMRGSPRLPYGYDPSRVLVGDVDGDGAADLVYVEDGRVAVWINQCGNGWSDPVVIEGTPRVGAVGDVRLADAYGNGISGVMWSTVTGGRHRMAFLDLTDGAKPYLLNESDNNCGAVTRIAYAPSTRFYLRDQKRAATRWREGLPFPMHVVERLETIDEVSRTKLTSEYVYHRGRWDGVEREHRGFGCVEQIDTLTRTRFHAAGLHGDADAFEDVPEQVFSPPTLKRMWFHQGPLEGPSGDWVEEDHSDEYCAGDPGGLERPIAMTDFLKQLPRRPRRDALRALRGQPLRTELYALDGSERQDRPYSVTEHLTGVSPLPVGQPLPAQPQPWQLRVFFPHALVERTTQWERGDDPMTRLGFTHGYDAYGRAISQLSIAVPRGRDYRKPVPAAQPYEPFLVTRTETEYATRDEAMRYIADRVAKTTRYEIQGDGGLTGDPRPSAAALAAAVEAGGLDERLLGQTLCFYDGDAYVGEDLGTLGDYGAPVRTEALALTADVLDDAYPARPPYLGAATGVQWPAEYPQEFRTTLPPLAGYHRQVPGAVAADHADGWWVATERSRCDFHDDPNGKGRGLILGKLNPLGAEGTAAFDSYGILPVDTTDAVGLTVSADYDYRALAPSEVTEPNGMRTYYRYTPLGRLRSVEMIGANGEGDTDTKPGTRYEYSFRDFEMAGNPISVRTIQRVHHASDTSVPAARRDDVLETVDFSDGYGRLIQTRRTAEDVVFEDTVHGGAGLPPDHTGTPSTPMGARVAAAAGPRVVVSGWTVHDNKGQAVEQYEPFFSTGWDFQPRAEAQVGEKVTIEYDPRGARIRTVNPDGSEERVVYGVPSALDDPTQFEPTPWEAYTWDANDNAGRTHAAAASGYQSHWNTPASTVLDALGRAIESTVRNGPATADGITTSQTFDIEGNVVAGVDALGRTVLRQVFDLCKRPLRTETLDAGVFTTVPDAASNEVESRDSRSSLVLRAYDPMKRPTRVWARDGSAEPMRLCHRIEYGDASSPGQPPAARQAAASAGLLGKLSRHYDDAGLLVVERYDFKGHPQEKVRRVIRDDRIAAVFTAAAADEWRVYAFGVDWQPPAGTQFAAHASSLLEAREYRSSIEYDALGRAERVRCPESVDGTRRTITPAYNRAGALKRLEVDGVVMVERIAYNAHGQRVLAAYAEQGRKGVMIRYGYDAQTFRLAHLRTERYQRPTAASLEYTPVAGSVPLQDVAYAYDLMGNVLRADDRARRSGIDANPDAAQETEATLAQLLAAGDALVRRFEYDPIYRLTSATGRECQSIPSPRPWDDVQRCGFGGGSHGIPGQDNGPGMSVRYRERYAYDPAGNLVALTHTRGTNGWTRSFGMGGRTAQQWDQDWRAHAGGAAWQNAPGNRLTHVLDGAAGTVPTHTFDDVGNLVRESTSRHFEWDWSGCLKAYKTQARAAGSQPADDRWSEPSVHAHYLYDASGQRVKKLVRRQGGQLETVVYIDDVFEHHRRPAAENNLIHVSDNRSRVATMRVGNAFPDDPSDAMLLHFGDHLGSSSVVANAAGSWVNREEWTPYGETTFGGFARKRFRFMGRERSEESGLAYHGARWYAPWLARWTSCDPMGLTAGPNSYVAFGDNPMRNVDPEGRQETDIAGGTPMTPQETAEFESFLGSEGSLSFADPIAGYHSVPVVALKAWAGEPTYSARLIDGPRPRTFWDRGGGTLVGGLAALGFGVILLASGPVGWFILLTAALLISSGIAATTWGATHVTLSYTGQLNEKQEQEMDLGGRLLLHTGSVSGFGGMLVSGVATQDIEGIDYGGTMGGLAEGASSFAVGGWRLVSREVRFGLLPKDLDPSWGNVRPQILEAYGLSDAVRWRPNAAFPRNTEWIELSHFASQRSTKGWLRWFTNRPCNTVPMWGGQHALIDPMRYQFMRTWWKAANPQIQGLSRFRQLAPDWLKLTGYGAYQAGSAYARDETVFPGDAGTPDAGTR